ncbi:hypothetical protein KAK07_07055 [Ideonella sp. 4Y16]|uniref:DNA-binding protein n=1 Tax=Ideonella alba TaxID=2824118 RepID=A0A940Y5K0_9BURK|nr:hypothetical protein [Ideonella alba]MBQ0929143.1 hypothetical protein [Ideonella alba]MBQ0943089.1 hypothetical protein [Ideonella alba]
MTFSDFMKRVKDEGGPDVRALPNATLAAALETAFGVITAEIRDAGEGDTRIPRLGVFRSKSVTAKEGPSAGKPVMRTVFVQLKPAGDKADDGAADLQDSSVE